MIKLANNEPVSELPPQPTPSEESTMSPSEESIQGRKRRDTTAASSLQKKDDRCIAKTKSGGRCTRRSSKKEGDDITLCTIHNRMNRGESGRKTKKKSDDKVEKTKEQETLDVHLMSEQIDGQKVFQDNEGRVFNEEGIQLGKINKENGQINLFAKVQE